MTLHPVELDNVVFVGDAADVVADLPDGVLHLTFTSPPYWNACHYGTASNAPTYPHYLDQLTHVFRHILRATRAGRYCIVNTSPILVPRPDRRSQSQRIPIPFDLHARLVAVGWEFVDDIVWLKPDGAACNRVAGFERHRQPLGYKPNPVTEYLMVYRKPTATLPDSLMAAYPDEVRDAAKVQGDYPRTNIWRFNPVRHPHHPAVFPLALAEQIIRLYSYPGDLVFDPYAGTGTTLWAAAAWGRRWCGVERHPDYIAAWVKQTGSIARFYGTSSQQEGDAA